MMNDYVQEMKKRCRRGSDLRRVRSGEMAFVCTFGTTVNQVRAPGRGNKSAHVLPSFSPVAVPNLRTSWMRKRRWTDDEVEVGELIGARQICSGDRPTWVR